MNLNNNSDATVFLLIQEYCRLSKLVEPSERDIERISAILELAQYDSELNCLINEADHLIAYDLGLSDERLINEADHLIAYDLGFSYEIEELNTNFRVSSCEPLEKVSTSVLISGTFTPQGYVQDLQQDLINILSKLEGLMSGFRILLSSNTPGKKYLEFQKEVAIVGAINAGKSTSINAISGLDILPNRASVMTTLPTEILLSTNELEPILVLTKSNLLWLKKTLSSLQLKICTKGLEPATAKMAKYPHLTELLPKIQDGFSIEAQTIGLKEIKEILTNLNDIVRVCTVLDPLIDPLNQEEFHVPCIYTPFWKATDTNQAKLLENLVIVDTPGLNEAGENLRLSAVVANQLRRSSMVIIVLDFTELNNKAAEEIKRQVQPVIRLLGKENLYVLVNKVDQRTEKDPMTSEKVKQFVLADLEIGELSDSGRVFEVAARWAFCAVNFLSELQHNPNIEKEEIKTARALAEQVFGIDWEEEFEDCSLEQLEKKAQKLWRKSGFKPFFENAINVLMESVAPRCIKSALINRLLKDSKEVARLSLEDYFAKEDYERGNLIEKLDIGVRKLFLSSLGEFELFPKWISEKFKSAVEFKTSGIFEFDSESKAEEFANQAVSYARHPGQTHLKYKNPIST